MWFIQTLTSPLASSIYSISVALIALLFNRYNKGMLGLFMFVVGFFFIFLTSLTQYFSIVEQNRINNDINSSAQKALDSINNLQHIINVASVDSKARIESTTQSIIDNIGSLTFTIKNDGRQTRLVIQNMRNSVVKQDKHNDDWSVTLSSKDQKTFCLNCKYSAEPNNIAIDPSQANKLGLQ